MCLQTLQDQERRGRINGAYSLSLLMCLDRPFCHYQKQLAAPHHLPAICRASLIYHRTSAPSRRQCITNSLAEVAWVHTLALPDAFRPFQTFQDRCARSIRHSTIGRVLLGCVSSIQNLINARRDLLSAAVFSKATRERNDPKHGCPSYILCPPQNPS